MSYITATRRNNLIVEAASDSAGANIQLNVVDLGNATQLWTFETTPIPGVFFIKMTASGNVITVPVGATKGTLPTLEPKREAFEPSQLWKFLSSRDGVNLRIQNYSLDGNGLVLDCNGGGTGTQCRMWTRDDDSDNQKFYMKI